MERDGAVLKIFGVGAGRGSHFSRGWGGACILDVQLTNEKRGFLKTISLPKLGGKIVFSSRNVFAQNHVQVRLQISLFQMKGGIRRENTTHTKYLTQSRVSTKMDKTLKRMYKMGVNPTNAFQ